MLLNEKGIFGGGGRKRPLGEGGGGRGGSSCWRAQSIGWGGGGC